MLCIWCNTHYSANSNRHYYCSRTCLEKHQVYKRKEERKYLLKIKQCEWCGKYFQPTRSSNINCSVQCCQSRRDTIKKSKMIGKCVVCLTFFRKNSNHQFSCSLICKKIRMKNNYLKPENLKKSTKRIKKYREKNREKANEYARMRAEKLTDAYVLSALRGKSSGLFLINEVPETLIETKKIQLKIKRHIKEMT